MTGQIRLKFDKEGFSINYFEFKLPLSIASYADLLNQTEEKLPKSPEETASGFGRFAYIANRFAKAAKKKTKF